MDIQAEREQVVREIKAVWADAEDQGREATPAERRQVEKLLAKAERLQAQAQVEATFGGVGNGGLRMTDPNYSSAGGGPGDMFVASKGYQQVKSPDVRPQTWTTGPVEVSSGPLMKSMGPHVMMKGTILETTTGGPGGGMVPPLYEPGVVSRLFEPLAVRDIFGQSNTTASQVRYVNEGTATSGAAGVAEAGVKPESTIAMSEVVEPIRKIATVLPISDELLEDAPSIQSYLNGRLTLFVSIEEERQLLRGNGTNELIGLFNRTGGQAIGQYTKLAADDNATALARVLANTAGSSFLQPDAIILHPTNWLSTRLLRDGLGGTAGNFLGGGPFTGAYGNGGATGMFGQTLWNTRVVLSSIVGPGTALVGNFGQGAHIWRRGGVTVEATNSHSDFFVKDLSMLRAEERLGLGLYRPVAFTEVRGLA